MLFCVNIALRCFSLKYITGFLSGFCPRGGKMTYYSMVVGGKDLSVPGIDLQCTCHFSIQVSSLIKR